MTWNGDHFIIKDIDKWVGYKTGPVTDSIDFIVEGDGVSINPVAIDRHLEEGTYIDFVKRIVTALEQIRLTNKKNKRS